MTTKTGRDRTIQQKVLQVSLRDPDVQAPAVGAQVDDGVVALAGTIDGQVIEVAAERAAQGAQRLSAVPNDLGVRTPAMYKDSDIAKAAAHALSSIPGLPADRIEVGVKAGVVTLRGTVQSETQRAIAVDEVHALNGVNEVVNELSVKPKGVSTEQVEDAIEAALVRAAAIDAKHIRVTVKGSHVRLQGRVSSWDAMLETVNAARRVQGVKKVTNQLDVKR